MTRRHVLFITRSLQPSHGGMQLYARLLIEGLRSQDDIRLTVVSYGGSKYGLPLFFVKAIIAALTVPCDQVHLGDAVFSPILPLLRLFRPRTKRSITVYGLDLTLRFAPYQWLLRLTLPFANRIVAISKATAAQAQIRRADPRNITVIPCGLQGTPVPDSVRPVVPTLLLLGRQIPRKGTVWFIKNVLPLVLKFAPDARVIVCGDGSAFDEIQKAIAISPHASQIDIRRSVTNEERERLYKTSSLFVMPNIEIAGDMEGFGLVCIEAASFGLPTVAAHTQGIIDAVIENETGLFFPAGNAEAAAEAIRNALEDPLPAAKVHAAFLKSFTIRSVIDQYMQHVFF